MNRGVKVRVRVLFVCGGTAGHINPAIAVADSLKSKIHDLEILFVGNPKGIEATLVPKAGYEFKGIEVAGLQRKVNLKNIQRNVKSAFLLMKSFPQAKKIIKEFSPDIIFGTGGYVSGPVLKQGANMGIKTVTHESNAFPGLTTKLLSKDVDAILLGPEGAKKHIDAKYHSKVTITGNPVRKQMMETDRELSRQKLGVGDRVCILSFGGSLGADRINEAVADFMKLNAETGKVYHIHATGKENYDDFIDMLNHRVVRHEDNANLDIRKYIDNMNECMAAADLVICRAGALTLAELIACNKASVLIPSPNVAENHQYHNAMELVSNGAAEIIEEKNLTGKLFCEKVSSLIEDEGRIAEISDNAKALYMGDANEIIISKLLSLLS